MYIECAIVSPVTVMPKYTPVYGCNRKHLPVLGLKGTVNRCKLLVNRWKVLVNHCLELITVLWVFQWVFLFKMYEERFGECKRTSLVKVLNEISPHPFQF